MKTWLQKDFQLKNINRIQCWTRSNVRIVHSFYILYWNEIYFNCTVGSSALWFWITMCVLDFHMKQIIHKSGIIQIIFYSFTLFIRTKTMASFPNAVREKENNFSTCSAANTNNNNTTKTRWKRLFVCAFDYVLCVFYLVFPPGFRYVSFLCFTDQKQVRTEFIHGT